MPDPISIGAAISGGSNLLTTGLNLWQNERQNRKSREFSREMYGRQHDDNIKFWNMQNAYNDPSAQMARLKAAGLNPAMIYGGQGSGAAGQAQAIHTPSAMAAKHKATDFKYLGRTIIDAMQAELMRKQGAQMDSATLLNIKRGNYIDAQAGETDFDVGLKKDLREISVQKEKELVRQMQAKTEYTLDENERRAAMTSQSISESIERIAKMRIDKGVSADRRREIEARIKDIQQSAEMKRHENRLRRKGMSFKDPQLLRMIATAVDSLLDEDFNLGEFFKWMMKF